MSRNFIYLIFAIILSNQIITAQFESFQQFPFSHSTSVKEFSILSGTSGDSLIMIYTDGEYIKFSKSENNGSTWGESEIIIDSLTRVIDYFDLNSIITSSGRILLIYKSFAGGLVHYTFSDDNGATWSAPEILPTGSNGLIIRRAKRLGISEISVSDLYCTYQRDDKIYTIRSFDDGETWTEEEFITQLNTSDNYSYPNLNKMPDGKLLLTYLDYEVDKNLLYSRTSNDTGQTWSVKTQITGIDENLLRLRTASNLTGQITITLEADYPFPAPLYSQSDIIYLNSADGINWSSPIRFTRHLGFDGNQYISSLSDRLFVSFRSERGSSDKQIWYGEIGVTQEEIISPILFNASHQILQSNDVKFTAVAFDDDSVSSIKLNYTLNDTSSFTEIMYDDGTNGDDTAGDYKYTFMLYGLSPLDKVDYRIIASDNELNSTMGDSTTFYIPPDDLTVAALVDVNNIKMPINNAGTIADVDLGNGAGGKYDDIIFMFSAGFYLSGLAGNEIWSNGNLSASRVEDYQPGLVGSEPDAPTNLIYEVGYSDPPFGEAWQLWRKAVEQGAKFFDGNNDDVYNPVDLNSNGVWDPNEDRPDLFTDRTYFCVYNDGIPQELRRYPIDPLGLEIRQTIFVSSGTNNNFLKDIIFVRYEIENTGIIESSLDSVYFGIATDTDIGDYQDDLVGTDILLQSSYCYNDGPDDQFGINPPASFTGFIQGAQVYIPGKTFIDNNSDGVYSSGIDTPLDSAYAKQGPIIGEKIYEGAANTDLTAGTQYMSSHPSHGDPATHLELRNYLIGGRGKNGDSLYVSYWPWGNGSALGSDTLNIESRFMYSGDPVTQTGWLNNTPIDQRFITATGPFYLIANEPVEIICAYIVGRGTDELNSISVAREITEYAHDLYQNNFSDMLTDINDNPNIIADDFKLYQNYPNPFNPTTTIKYQIPSNVKGQMANVKIIVFDILGREVKTLVNEQKPTGIYEFIFDGSKLSSGIYFYQLSAGDFIQTKKLMLIK